MKTIEALRGTHAYPVPLDFLKSLALKRGLDLEAEQTAEGMHAAAFIAGQADILLFVSTAPNVSEGGQSYSFTAEERKQLRKRATSLYKLAGTVEEAEAINAEDAEPTYGYKGSRL